MLSRVIEWYNELKEITIDCEFKLIASEIVTIDSKLDYFINKTSWREYEQELIQDVYTAIQNLNERVRQTKRNIDRIVRSMREWGQKPLYERNLKSSAAIMVPDDFTMNVLKREDNCAATKDLIDELMEENFRLFFNLPVRPRMSTRVLKKSYATPRSTMRRTTLGRMTEDDENSQSTVNISSASGSAVSLSAFEIDRTTTQQILFRAYEEYIDSIVGDELIDAIKFSIRYILMEMSKRTEKDKNTPLFNVKLELQIPDMVFIPPLDSEELSLQEIIQNMILYIYNMSSMIPKIAQPPEEERKDEDGNVVLEDFTSCLEDSQEIENMKIDIVTMTKRTVKNVIKYTNELKKYSYLWLFDKQEKLQEFLQFSRFLTEQEADKLEHDKNAIPEKKPTLQDFQAIIDKYGDLYEEINKLEVYHVFYDWLGLDMKAFKHSLLNEVCKWSNLFKQYLYDNVLTSLKGLENFIHNSSITLEQEVTNDDYATLLEVMIVLDNINKNQAYYDKMFEPLKAEVDLLASYDMTFDEKIHDQVREENILILTI